MQSRLAVLIDADNAQADLIEALLDEVIKYGVASVKRIYGDWTQPNLGKWKKKLVEHAIQPMQQFGYTVGKNATDSALIIDAMDLLYTQKFDGFCLVTSDSDFTRLATRLRESGLTVYGFGEKKTPRAFISACDKFIYVENLRPAKAEKAEKADKPAKKTKAAAAAPGAAIEAVAEKKPSRRKKKTKAEDDKAATAVSPAAALAEETPAERPENELAKLIGAALDACADESGWAHLGALGQYILKRRPDFDTRSYGKKRLGDLVKTLEGFVVDTRVSADGKSQSMHVHRK